MYLTRIAVDQVELSLSYSDGSPRMWTVLVGKGSDQLIRSIHRTSIKADQDFFILRLEDGAPADVRPEERAVLDEGDYMRTLNRVLGTDSRPIFPELTAGGSPSRPMFHTGDGCWVDLTKLPSDLQVVLAMLLRIVDCMVRSGTDAGLVIGGEFGYGVSQKMQPELVNHLRRVLPKVQFIVKTRSPTILSSFTRREVIPLRRDVRSNLISVWDVPTRLDPLMLTSKAIVETWPVDQGRTSFKVNPLGRDRRTLAGILEAADEMLNDNMRRRAVRLSAELSKTLGPPEHWLEESELRRLGELRARAAP